MDMDLLHTALHTTHHLDIHLTTPDMELLRPLPPLPLVRLVEQHLQQPRLLVTPDIHLATLDIPLQLQHRPILDILDTLPLLHLTLPHPHLTTHSRRDNTVANQPARTGLLRKLATAHLIAPEVQPTTNHTKHDKVGDILTTNPPSLTYHL